MIRVNWLRNILKIDNLDKLSKHGLDSCQHFATIFIKLNQQLVSLSLEFTSKHLAIFFQNLKLGSIFKLFFWLNQDFCELMELNQTSFFQQICIIFVYFVRFFKLGQFFLTFFVILSLLFKILFLLDLETSAVL